MIQEPITEARVREIAERDVPTLAEYMGHALRCRFPLTRAASDCDCDVNYGADGEKAESMLERMYPIVVTDRADLLDYIERRLTEHIDFLSNVLTDAAKQFRYYEQLHSRKGTADGDEKARVNAAHAAACESSVAMVRDRLTGGGAS